MRVRNEEQAPYETGTTPGADREEQIIAQAMGDSAQANRRAAGSPVAGFGAQLSGREAGRERA